ncbi:glutaminyl-tRNA synthetase [Ramicandelaber brevisporus]|nr:glutaminyl-tRNA synthetase [Ramicandelaber brevisporus]
MSDSFIALFTKLGLSEQKAAETAKNAKISGNIALAAKAAGSLGDLPAGHDDLAKYGTLVYLLGSTATKITDSGRIEYIANAIRDGRLKTSDQVSAAIKFAEKRNPASEVAAFESECGVGVSVSDEKIAELIAAIINKSKAKLEKDRYRAVGPLLGEFKRDPVLKWAPGAAVKTESDRQILALLGPKDERDDPKLVAAKAKASPSPASSKSPEATPVIDDPLADLRGMLMEGDIAKLHKAGGNPQIREELIKKHLAVTGGKVMTRFPPEPNGFLHIGHAKAININFGYAQLHNGLCYLRYDDTNPEAEKDEYFESILHTIEWLGFEPWKITYSSDNFAQLYEYAHTLINKGKAYVCTCSKEELFEQRGGAARGPRFACAHRDRPIDESRAEFIKMKEGAYKEGECILRMKMELLESGNPYMWDAPAYRIKHTPHPRTGSEWCIYPTYDFAHCLCDSLENISHSLCTTEFIDARESYYWICDQLEVYKPVQWEYGRLNVTGTVLSKRKFKKLLEEGIVKTLDDPRLYTLPALRRRGIPPQAINKFVRSLGGVTTTQSVIQLARLDACIRDYLGTTAPRLMAVVKPLLVTLRNVPEDFKTEVSIPFMPAKGVNAELAAEFGSRTLTLTNKFYIDRSDFRVQSEADFLRLTLNGSVGLMNIAHPITCVDVKYAADGSIESIVCDVNFEATGKPKAYIQWVNASDAVKIGEVHLYSSLFHHENPDDEKQVPSGWFSDVNQESDVVETGAFIEPSIWDIIHKWIARAAAGTVAGAGKNAGIQKQQLCGIENVRAQFMRIGYFALDLASTVDSLNKKDLVDEHGLLVDPVAASKLTRDQLASSHRLVFNRTTALKEDSKKN